MSDVYDDFDELADFALTSSEPPPPGTVPLEVELLSLITETSSDITLNKEEVAAWLRSEDAILTGQRLVAPILHPYPSPPSSAKYSISDSATSNDEISGHSPPSKKSKHKSSEEEPEGHTIASVVQVKSPRRRRRRRDNSGDEKGERTRKRGRVTSSDYKRSHSRRSSSHREERGGENVRRGGENVRRRRDELTEPRPKHRPAPHHWPRYWPRRKEFRDARGLLTSRAEDRAQFEKNIKKLEQQIKESEEGARRLVREARHAKEDLDNFVKNNVRTRDNVRSQDNVRSRDNVRTRNDKRDNVRTRDNVRSWDDVRTRDRKWDSSWSNSQSRSTSSKDEMCTRDVRRRRREEEWVIRPPNKWDEHQIEGAGIIVSGFNRDTSRKDLFSYFSSYGTVTDVQLSSHERSKVACIIFKRQSEADKVLGTSQQQDTKHKSSHQREHKKRRTEETPTPPCKTTSEIDILTPPNSSSFDILLNALRKDLTPQKLP